MIDLEQETGCDAHRALPSGFRFEPHIGDQPMPKGCRKRTRRANVVRWRLREVTRRGRPVVLCFRAEVA